MFFKRVLFCVSILAAQPALADTITLNNGDKISGTVLSSEVSNNIALETQFDQIIYIPMIDVKEVAKQEGNQLKRYRPQRVAKKQTPFVRPQMIATVVEKPVVTPPAAKTKEKADTPEKIQWLGAEWSGLVNLGASLQTGNSEKDSINADAHAEAKWNEKHRSVVDLEYNREKDDGTITEDNKAFDAQHDYFFADQWFINNFLGLENDEIEEIDLRTDVGSGLGYQAYESHDLNLKFILGAAYLHEEYEDGTNEESVAGRWMTGYDQRFFDNLFQAFHKHEILVPTEDTEDFLLETESGVRVPLKKGLVATAQIDFDWDNEPEPGIEEEDTKYSIKIGYEW